MPSADIAPNKYNGRHFPEHCLSDIRMKGGLLQIKQTLFIIHHYYHFVQTALRFPNPKSRR